MEGNDHARDWRPILAAMAMLATATLAVYGPAVGFDFVNIDDNQYVTDNAHVQQGLTWKNLTWAFTTTEASFWHPLVWVSHMAVVSVAGLNAGAHHAVNVALHLVCAWLLLGVLWRYTGRLWPSAFVALFFAVHPLHVESVAWVSQRKDVLSTVFWMLTLLAYGRYVRHPGVGRYALVVVAFVLGLMAKPMLVTLPCVLLLLDFWPLKRLTMPLRPTPACARRFAVLALEKTPLFALAAVFSVVAYVAQASGGALGDAPWTMRLKVAVAAYGWYLVKTVWPANLAVFYPYPDAAPSMPAVLSVTALLAAITLVVSALANRRPYLLVGWLWYMGTLVPVSGIVHVGHYAWADRFTYVPLVGLFVAAVWLMADTPRAVQRVAAAAGLVVAFGWSLTAAYQVQYWRSSETLFRRALAVTENNFLAHNNLGAALLDTGEVDAATAEFHRAIAINPRYADAYNNLAIAAARTERFDEAVAHARKAIELAPAHVHAHINLGSALLQAGAVDDAVVALDRAVQLSPERMDAHYNLALALDAAGRSEDALRHFELVLARQPDDPDAGYYYGMALAGLGRVDEAIVALEHVVNVDPTYGRAWLNLGIARLMQGLHTQAVASLQKAVTLLPDDAEAHFNLGMALGQTGNEDAAVAQFQRAATLDPGHTRARAMLERLGVTP